MSNHKSRGNDRGSFTVPPVRNRATTIINRGNNTVITTGIGHWEEHTDPETGRIFFFDPQRSLNSWGLPLKDTLRDLKDKKLKAPKGTDDWQCHVDPKSFRRFYRSEMYNKVQWRPPHIYGPILANLPYFSDAFIKQCLTNRKAQKLKKMGISPEEVLNKVTFDQVLENSVLCAGFHRFLVAAHAEENILFYGACEVFEKGEWKGQTALGAQMKAITGSNEIDEGNEELMKQLQQTRASIRIGLPLEHKTMKDEASILYHRFLAPHSDMWVCVSNEVAKQAKEKIDAATPTTDLRGTFLQAQQDVFDSMSVDLFPRFVKSVMIPDFTPAFEADEVLRIALLDLAGIAPDL